MDNEARILRMIMKLGEAMRGIHDFIEAMNRRIDCLEKQIEAMKENRNEIPSARKN